MFDERWFDSCGVCGWKPENPKELRQITVRIKPGHRGSPPWESPSRGYTMIEAWKRGDEGPEPYRLFVCEECAKAAAEAWAPTPSRRG